MSRLSRILMWTLGSFAVTQLLFVNVPFWAQRVHTAQLDDLARGTITYEFLGVFGYAVALMAVTFGYSLLGPLTLILFASMIMQRSWKRLWTIPIIVLPWLLILPYHSRLVDWFWL